MTNFDKIKKMTFTEMAEFIDNLINDGSKKIDWELEEKGIVDDFNNPWTGIEEAVLWLGLDTDEESQITNKGEYQNRLLDILSRAYDLPIQDL